MKEPKITITDSIVAVKELRWSGDPESTDAMSDKLDELYLEGWKALRGFQKERNGEFSTEVYRPINKGNQ